MRLFLIPALLTACGPGKTGDTGGGGDDDPTGGTDGPECADDGDCLSTEICEDDACTDGDRDNSPEEATYLFEADVAEGEINPAGDEDWYAFVSSEGGEFIVAHTEDAEDEDVLDTVVSIYDETGHLLAYEDEHPGGNIGSGYDSVCYAYLAAAGTYYVKVEDIGHFDGGTGLGGDDADYTVVVETLGAADEPDSLQDAALDFGEVRANVWYSVQAALEEAGDADYAVFDLPERGMPLSIIVAQNDAGSDATPRVTLYNEDGDAVLTFEDPDASDRYAYLPASRSDRYVLAVDDADGGGGATFWGFGFFILREAGSGNADEVEPNDDVDAATVLDMEDQEPDAGERWSGYGQGVLSTADDVDVFAAEVPFDDAYLTVALGAQGYGGSLVARIEILDVTGAVFATQDSEVGDDVNLEDAGPLPAGTWYVRVSAVPDTGALGGDAYFYVFGVHASSTN
ncbi:MAG: hypothetical protein ACOZNI_02420 [Myxococcota bacterium]